MTRAGRTQVPRTPSYRHHKKSGLAVVTLSAKDHYLGEYGSEESKREFRRLIAEWSAAGGHLPEPGTDLTVNEMLVPFWRFATDYYVKNGKATGEQQAFRYAIQPLRRLYGDTFARDFGPVALKACRAWMVDQGWCRSNINRQVARVRQVFRWAVEAELIPASVLHGLSAVRGLRRGRSDVKEGEPIRPVPDDLVKTVLPLAAPEVKAMVELQELAGMRPSEVVAMRGCDLTTDGDLWEYRPAEHKTEHHGRDRVIMLGPRAQAITKPYLKTDTEAFLFSPAAAEDRRNAERRAKRKSPMTPSQAKRRRKPKPKRAPRDRYTVDSYRRAIHRGCDQAWPAPEGLEPAEVATWRQEHRWSPNRLRHNRATKLRKRYGVEAARVVLV